MSALPVIPFGGDRMSPITAADPQTSASLRSCAWCRGTIAASTRRDAVCCSVRCRQARHRFAQTVGRATASGTGPLHLAYADPPYPGKAWYYRDHPDYRGEVDHAALIRRLSTYDGWALSTSAEALPAVLALCQPGARVAAWHRGERPTHSWRPLHAWEPVIYHGGRPVDPSRLQSRRIDSLVHGIAPMTTLPGRVIGAKPAAFCRWMFDLLGAQPGDTLHDLYPGSGAVTRAWATFTRPQPDHSEVSRRSRADASHPAAYDASRAAVPDASRAAGASPLTPSTTASPTRRTEATA
jgi:hypothetical protein